MFKNHCLSYQTSNGSQLNAMYYALHCTTYIIRCLGWVAFFINSKREFKTENIIENVCAKIYYC